MLQKVHTVSIQLSYTQIVAGSLCLALLSPWNHCVPSSSWSCEPRKHFSSAAVKPSLLNSIYSNAPAFIALTTVLIISDSEQACFRPSYMCLQMLCRRPNLKFAIRESWILRKASASVIQTGPVGSKGEHSGLSLSSAPSSTTVCECPLSFVWLAMSELSRGGKLSDFSNLSLFFGRPVSTVTLLNLYSQVSSDNHCHVINNALKMFHFVCLCSESNFPVYFPVYRQSYNMRFFFNKLMQLFLNIPHNSLMHRSQTFSPCLESFCVPACRLPSARCQHLCSRSLAICSQSWTSLWWLFYDQQLSLRKPIPEETPTSVTGLS